MVRPTTTPQIVDVLGKIRNCLEQNKFFFTKHALERGIERKIDFQDAIYVLKAGNHEKRKTSFDSIHSTWKYAIRGKTLDGLDLRLIIAFDEDGMIIITVMEVV